jgi:hypothetical protein
MIHTPSSPASKPLTKNQILGERTESRSEPANDKPPAYINWYINGYGRPWTPSDVNPRIRPVHGQIEGIGGVLLTTTEQKAFVAVSVQRSRWFLTSCRLGSSHLRSVHAVCPSRATFA